MKVLFVMRHAGYVRNIEAVLRSLSERGHEIHLAFQVARFHDVPEVADRLVAEYPTITYGGAPPRLDRWLPLAFAVRHTLDYLRYLSPFYRNTPKLRARAEKHTPRWILWLTKLPLLRARPFAWLLSRLARFVDRAIPTDPEIDRFIAEHDPDLVMVTPLIAGHVQEDYVRSARAQGRHTALPVNSWDNLTNKGLVREVPDRIYVWNETQRTEAQELHGIRRSKVAVVGAHTYDHWFAWKPSTTRQEFCDRVGVDPERPFVLYLCSSGFICPDERPIVDKWLETLRAQSDPALAEVSVVIRPHPSSGHLWAEHSVERFGAVVFPAAGADPRNTGNRNDYYDSFHHCAAVVGINTSAMVEAAIVGRRSYGFRLPELFEGQEGTIHFHRIRSENGGPLTLSESLEEHFERLGADLGNGRQDGWNETFLRSFLRPKGLHVACTPLFVADLEHFLAAGRPAPLRTGRIRTAVVRPLALLAARKDRGRLAQGELASAYDTAPEVRAQREAARALKEERRKLRAAARKAKQEARREKTGAAPKAGIDEPV